jgi:hypothetical protein
MKSAPPVAFAEILMLVAMNFVHNGCIERRTGAPS